jgi:hypothetical protein
VLFLRRDDTAPGGEIPDADQIRWCPAPADRQLVLHQTLNESVAVSALQTQQRFHPGHATASHGSSIGF